MPGIAAPFSHVAPAPVRNAKRGAGVYGLSVIDGLSVTASNDPTACSAKPPAVCNDWVPLRILRNSLSTSSAYGSASLATITGLGSLTGSGQAADNAKAQQSSVASMAIAWEDSFTVTSSSKTLPAGSTVKFTAIVDVTGPRVRCSAASGVGLSIFTSGTGEDVNIPCGSSPARVTVSHFTTTVGATFLDGRTLVLSGDAGTAQMAGTAATGTYTVVYHLRSDTSGASYITASGESYP